MGIWRQPFRTGHLVTSPSESLLLTAEGEESGNSGGEVADKERWDGGQPVEDVGGVGEQEAVVLYQATGQQQRVWTVAAPLLNWKRCLDWILMQVLSVLCAFIDWCKFYQSCVPWLTDASFVSLVCLDWLMQVLSVLCAFIDWCKFCQSCVPWLTDASFVSLVCLDWCKFYQPCVPWLMQVLSALCALTDWCKFCQPCVPWLIDASFVSLVHLDWLMQVLSALCAKKGAHDEALPLRLRYLRSESVCMHVHLQTTHAYNTCTQPHPMKLKLRPRLHHGEWG